MSMDYETRTIALTLNGVTKTLDAPLLQYGNGQWYLAVRGIMLTTSTGKMAHEGLVNLSYVEGREGYTAADICYASYPGMRGNGVGRPSTLRHIAFA